MRALGALPPPSAFPTREAALALRAKLSPAEIEQLRAAAAAALPSCWGARTRNCATGEFDKRPLWPEQRCQALAYGYLADWDGFKAAINALPYCDEQAPLRYAAIGAGVGLVIGIGLGLAFG